MNKEQDPIVKIEEAVKFLEPAMKMAIMYTLDTLDTFNTKEEVVSELEGDGGPAHDLFNETFFNIAPYLVTNVAFPCHPLQHAYEIAVDKFIINPKRTYKKEGRKAVIKRELSAIYLMIYGDFCGHQLNCRKGCESDRFEKMCKLGTFIWNKIQEVIDNSKYLPRYKLSEDSEWNTFQSFFEGTYPNLGYEIFNEQNP